MTLDKKHDIKKDNEKIYVCHRYLVESDDIPSNLENYRKTLIKN